MDTTLA